MAAVLAAMRMAIQILFTVNLFSLTRCARTIMRARRRCGHRVSFPRPQLTFRQLSWPVPEVRRNDLTLLRQGLGSASRNRPGFANSPFDDYFNWGAAIRPLRPLCDQGSFPHQLLHLPPIV